MNSIFKTKLLSGFAAACVACAITIPNQARADSVYEPYIFFTLAGGGPPGSTDGTGAAASFSRPNAVTTDSAGNVYVGDFNDHTIRKVTPLGVVTTLAGTAGTAGSADGTGTAAQFHSPSGVATDSAGNIYVSDYWNFCIRKVTPAGVVTTFAGAAGQYGIVDGTGSAARFTLVSGVAVDASGNVYVADFFAEAVRKITPAGVVTTLAGHNGSGYLDGPGTNAMFNGPDGIAVDSSGNVYVSDFNNNVIRKVTPDGVVSTFAGQPGVIGSNDGTGNAAQFAAPVGLATDSSDNIYVADRDNAVIRKITPAAMVTTLGGLAGTGGYADGTGSAARFNSPEGVATDSSGNIYVGDSGNNAVRKGSVRCQPISVNPATLAATNLCLYSENISASGGGAPYTYLVTGGALPSGFTLSTNGTLSGLAVTASASTFTVTATDVNGCTGSTTYTLAIAPSGNPLDTTAPVVAIVSPKNKANINGSAAVTVTGTAKDSSGTVKSGIALVTYSLNGAALQAATTTTKFTNWAANITLLPGWNSFTAQAFDNAGNASASLTDVYYYGVPTDVTGTYDGLFRQTNSSGAPVITVPTAGTLTVSVNISRNYSAKLYLDGVNYPIKAAFDLNGDSNVTVSRASSGKGDLALNLHLDWTGVSKQITGTVSCANEGWTSSVVAIWTFKSK